MKNEEEVIHNLNEANEHGREVKVHDINLLDPQKRLRVWENQIDGVIESLKPSNYLTELYSFMKGCSHLSKSYPNHEDLGHVDSIRIEFWAKYQKKFKEEIVPLIKRWKREEIRKDLVRMGFI